MKEKKPFSKTHPSAQCSRVFSGPILSLKCYLFTGWKSRLRNKSCALINAKCLTVLGETIGGVSPQKTVAVSLFGATDFPRKLLFNWIPSFRSLFTLRSSRVCLLTLAPSRRKCAEEKLGLVFPLLFPNTIGLRAPFPTLPSSGQTQQSTSCTQSTARLFIRLPGCKTRCF